MKLDIIDKKILFELDKNARLPVSMLSKNLKLSQQATGKRLKRLVTLGVIKKAITIINTSKLGFASYRMYIRYQNVSPEQEKRIIEYVLEEKNIFWAASLYGSWDLEILVFAKSFYHFNEIWNRFLTQFSRYISDFILSLATYNYHYKRRYLTNNTTQLPEAYYGGEPEDIDLDKTDIALLDIISTDARIHIIDLSKKLKLTSNAVRYRINSLERLKIIQTYRLWVDISKYNYELHKALVKTTNITKAQEARIISFCNNVPNTLYVIKCFGPWGLELEFEVRNSEEYHKIMMDFRNEFSEIIKSIETIRVYKELKIKYFPL